MRRPDELRREMMTAGDRLIAAISVEAERSRRVARASKNKSTLLRWQRSRRRVELLTTKYVHAIARYREAMAGVTVSTGAMDFKPGWGVYRGKFAGLDKRGHSLVSLPV